MRITGIALAAAALFASAPASACYTGPVPVAFLVGTTTLSRDGEQALGEYAWMRREHYPRSTIRILVYNSGVSSPALWRSRVAAARSYLVRNRIAAQDIEVVNVRTQRGMSGGRWIGRTTKMEVELVAGCG